MDREGNEVKPKNWAVEIYLLLSNSIYFYSISVLSNYSIESILFLE